MLSDNQIWDLLGHKIEVELDTGDRRSRKSTIGHLMTRDPVSKSLLLAKMESDSIESIEWIPSCSYTSIKLLEETGNVEANAAINEYFADRRQGGTIKESEESILNRALKVVNYLKSNHLDVVEKPAGVYTIAGAVRFERPYHAANLYCDIPIVLKRILKLIEQIDSPN